MGRRNSMTLQEAKDMIKAKLTCLELDSDIEGCDGDCKDCEYSYTQGTFREQKEAFKIAIKGLEELKKYKDLEEQGLLLRLPFPVGTELYFPFKLQGVKKDRIRRWQLNKKGLFFCAYAGNAYRLEVIGKTVFLTKEEAEAALAEMEK